MSHEHSGECCSHHHEPAAGHEHAHDHTHRIAEKIGSLCCQGMCSHPEHQVMSQLALRNMFEQLELEQDDDDEDEDDPKHVGKNIPKWRKLKAAGI